jgi:hypothetical protein
MLRSTSTTVVALTALLTVACGAGEDVGPAADEPSVAVEDDEATEEDHGGDAEARDDAGDADAGDAEAADEDHGDAGDGDGDDPTAPDDGAATSPQPIRSAEGLPEQLRLLFDPGELPEGFEPDTTGWRDHEPPAGLDDAYGSPGALALALAVALDAEALGEDLWETTTRVLLDQSDPDQAYVAVLSWGLADDAVVGRDVRMTITRSDDGWEPGGAEERHHCQRGVDGDRCA